MSEPPIQTSSEFDAYAVEYDAQHCPGNFHFGRRQNYFARGRVVWLARCLARLQKHPRTALDFGCGTGSATPFLLNQLKGELASGGGRIGSITGDCSARPWRSCPVYSAS
jgi:hypothetical protein